MQTNNQDDFSKHSEIQRFLSGKTIIFSKNLINQSFVYQCKCPVWCTPQDNSYFCERGSIWIENEMSWFLEKRSNGKGRVIFWNKWSVHMKYHMTPRRSPMWILNYSHWPHEKRPFAIRQIRLVQKNVHFRWSLVLNKNHYIFYFHHDHNLWKVNSVTYIVGMLG